MRHQQIQLASKRNFIRLMALVAMLAVMVCGMVIMASAADAVESVTFEGSNVALENGYWVKTYDGTDAVTGTVKVNGQAATAVFDSANVAEARHITVTYDNGKTIVVPAKIKQATLTWNADGAASVDYNANGEYINVAVTTVPAANALVGVVSGETVSFDNQVTVSFETDGVGATVAYAQVTLTSAQAANYTVESLKVNVTVNPIAINTITWEGIAGPFTYGDDLSGIKALGNGTIPMVVNVQSNAAGSCTLVATAPSSIYKIADGVNATQTITIANKTYNVALNDREFLDNGALVNPGAGSGYQLVVEGDIPADIFAQIVYKYYKADGSEVTGAITEPGAYTVKATMPTIEGVTFSATELEATMTVVRNYLVVATPDGSIIIVGENGIPASVKATLTIPTEFANKAVRGLKAYKGYALTVTGAGEDDTFTIYIPVASGLIAHKNAQALTADNLYIYNGEEGTKAAASGTYTVTLSEDGSYYIVEGYVPEGEITFMLAPEYKTPFWSSAIGIALIILIALLLLLVLPIFIGMKLIQREKSGRNPVISVETEGNVPEVEPVVIPDKIEDPDAILEEGVEALAESLAEEVAPEEAEIDVDATDAVADAMAQLNEEVAAVDLGNADGALDEMTDQLVLDLMDQVAAEENEADVSDEVKQAVADAMAENFNESADATDAIALVEEEEVVEEPVVEEVVEEPVVEVVEEAVVEEAPVEEAVVEPAPEAEEAEEDEEESFGGFGSMPLDYIDAIAEAERYAEMLEQESRGEVQLVTRYRRSYLSRLAQSQGSIQDYYNAIKNLLLSYKGVKSRVSWNFESFNVGRTPLAKFNAKTRTLYVYIAFSPEELADTKYNFTDMSAKKKYAAVPVLIKIKGERKFKHALELLTKLCEEKLQLPKKKTFTETDYRMPFKTTEELVQEGIIKMMVAAIPVAAPAAEEAVVEEVVAEEAVAEEAVVEEAVPEEVVAEEAVAEEAVAEEAVAEEAVAEEAVAEEAAPETNENA